MDKENFILITGLNENIIKTQESKNINLKLKSIEIVRDSEPNSCPLKNKKYVQNNQILNEQIKNIIEYPIINTNENEQIIQNLTTKYTPVNKLQNSDFDDLKESINYNSKKNNNFYTPQIIKKTSNKISEMGNYSSYSENNKNKENSDVNVPSNSSKINLTKQNNLKLRKKEFKINYSPDWFIKNEVPQIKLTHEVVHDIEFQSNYIIDEMNLFFDNLKFYKMSFLSTESKFTQIFRTLELFKQIKINKILEEICGLSIATSNLILVDFSQYLNKLNTVKIPNLEKDSNKFVKNEEICFDSNLILFNESCNFLKSCFEIYTTLVKQIDDLILPYKQFMIVIQYLARLRLNLSNLIFSTRNYLNNVNNDKKLVDKFKIKKLTVNKSMDENLEYIQDVINNDDVEDSKNNNKVEKIYNINNKRFSFNKNIKSRSSNLLDKISSQIRYKKNEYKERARRLECILNKKNLYEDNKWEEKKRKIKLNKPKNSKLVDKLFKYCPAELKYKIVCERISNNNLGDQS